MKPPTNKRAPQSAAQRLRSRQKRLLEEIDLYLQKHRELSRGAKQGLRNLEALLLERIDEFNPAKKV